MREEMRRVLSYFNWKSSWWLDRASALNGRNDELALGSIVYANRQALDLLQLGRRFRQNWMSECNITDLPEINPDQLIFIKEFVELPRFNISAV